MAELTAEYLDEVVQRLATKGEIEGIHSRLDFLSAELTDFKSEVRAFHRHVKEDDTAYAKDLLELKSRMAALEKELKKLKQRRTQLQGE